MREYMYRKNISLGFVLGVMLLFIGLSACEKAEPEAEFNVLTEEEREEGWQLVFNGSDLEGWRGYNKQAIPTNWSIDDNALHYQPVDTTDEARGDLLIAQEYQDFELEFDWKIGECGNSGVMFHVAETGYQYPWLTGPEYQVLDNSCHPDAKVGRDRWAGANYALNIPDSTIYAEVEKPAGSWNHSRLVVNGPHVEHWLNGKKVVEYELGSDDWKQRVAASKFIDMPDYGQKSSGYIVFQDHGDPVWYRNIKVRPLNGQAPV